MDLAADLRLYVKGRRDSKKEQALLRRIRALPQQQRMEVLAPILDFRSRAALDLANRAQLSHRSYLSILKQGLAESHSTMITSCLRATVYHLGWRKVFSVFSEALTGNPRRAAFALHELSDLLRDKESSEVVAEYFQLIVLYHENGYPVISPDAFEAVKAALWDIKHA